MKTLARLSLVLITLLTCAAIVGCSTTSRTTKNKDGTSTSTKQSSLFITVQGYDDSIDANGAQHTSIANFATDAQGIIAMDNLLNHFMQNMAFFVAANQGTNSAGTNALAILLQRMQQDQPKPVTSSRHLYKELRQ